MTIDTEFADPDGLRSGVPPSATVPPLLDRLLAGAGEEPEPAGTRETTRLLLLALAGFVAYGAVSGLFQGGGQVWVSALKAPCAILLAIVLCLPSLVVGTTLAGASWSARRLAHAVASFAAALGVALASLLPIAWLFSVSSRRLTTVVIFHVAAWVLAIALGRRALRAAVPVAARGPLGAWSVLVFLVSLQAATVLQPVLYRLPDQPLFDRERELFLDQLGDTSAVELDEDGALVVRRR